MACGSSCGGGCGGGAELPEGVLTELVIADEGEARRVAEDAAPSRRWPGVDAKGLDQVKLSTLWSLLSGRPFCDELLLEFAPLDEVSEDGPWVFRVPPPLVGLLAALEVDRAGAVAEAWATSEELELDGWEPAEVRAMLDGLRGVARAAQAAKKPVLMWVSL
jgi:hypothetical protein